MNISVSMVVCMVTVIMSVMSVVLMSVIVYVGHCLLLADYRTNAAIAITFRDTRL